MFGLSWKGTLICFLAKVSELNAGSSTTDLYWDIDLPIPDALLAQKEEIETALKEAFEAHGYLYSGPQGNCNVHISIR